MPTVTQPKNTGKANSTTGEQQAEIEAQAKYTKKLKEGYVEDISKVDEIKFIKPMLAHPIKQRKEFNYPIICQHKRNGSRCIITKNGAFSRKGEEFFNIEHIKKELEPVFAEYPDLVLDGELDDPNDQKNLNRVIKLISTNRKEKDITDDLKEESKQIIRYAIYDGYLTGKESEQYMLRFSMIQGVVKNLTYSKMVENYVAINDEQVTEFFDKVVSEGWEGGYSTIP